MDSQSEKDVKFPPLVFPAQKQIHLAVMWLPESRPSPVSPVHLSHLWTESSESILSCSCWDSACSRLFWGRRPLCPSSDWTLPSLWQTRRYLRRRSSHTLQPITNEDCSQVFAHKGLTADRLSAPADLLHVVLIVVFLHQTADAVHRLPRLFQLSTQNYYISAASLNSPQSQPERGTWTWLRSSGLTLLNSSSSSSKVKALNLELCQYSSSSALLFIICTQHNFI